MINIKKRWQEASCQTRRFTIVAALFISFWGATFYWAHHYYEMDPISFVIRAIAVLKGYLAMIIASLKTVWLVKIVNLLRIFKKKAFWLALVRLGTKAQFKKHFFALLTFLFINSSKDTRTKVSKLKEKSISNIKKYFSRSWNFYKKLSMPVRITIAIFISLSSIVLALVTTWNFIFPYLPEGTFGAIGRKISSIWKTIASFGPWKWLSRIAGFFWGKILFLFRKTFFGKISGNIVKWVFGFTSSLIFFFLVKETAEEIRQKIYLYRRWTLPKKLLRFSRSSRKKAKEKLSSIRKKRDSRNTLPVPAENRLPIAIKNEKK